MKCRVFGLSLLVVLLAVPSLVAASAERFEAVFSWGCVTDEDTARVQRLAERVYQALHLEAYGRADFLMDRETKEIYCLEANTLPGMTVTSLIPQEAAAVGMSFEQLIEKIIMMAWNRR